MKNEHIDEYLSDIALHFILHKLPHHMWEGVRMYLANGVLPGDFLCALFENKLLSSFAHADDENKKLLEVWVLFLTSRIPVESHGSSEKFQQWMNDGGLYGREEFRIAYNNANSKTIID